MYCNVKQLLLVEREFTHIVVVAPMVLLQHNKATGDNVGPLIISFESNVPAEPTAGPLASSPALSTDPMENFCGDNPEADECRVYED